MISSKIDIKDNLVVLSASTFLLKIIGLQRRQVTNTWAVYINQLRGIRRQLSSTLNNSLTDRPQGLRRQLHLTFDNFNTIKPHGIGRQLSCQPGESPISPGNSRGLR